MTTKRLAIVLVLVLLAALLLSACGGDEDDKDDGPRVYQVGVVLSNSFQFVVSNSLKVELAKLGYTEGENIHYTIIVAETPERLNEAIDELVAAKVDVIYTSGAGEAKAALARTRKTPIVFASGFTEIVELLREPQAEGALVTGITFGDATTKRLDILLKIDPRIDTIYAPYDPTNELSAAGFALLDAIAPELGITVIGVQASDIAGVRAAIDAIPDEADAIFLWTERFAVETWPLWTAAGLEHQVATSIPTANIEILEFLMGYGPDFDLSGAQSARIVDRVLRGDPANQIPIEPSDPQLAINQGVANQIGIEVPDTYLEQAALVVYDENPQSAVVIESEEQTQGACNTTLNSPLGVTASCVTVTCSALNDTTILSFVDKQDVEECDTEGAVGVCSTAGSSTYFYEGDPSLLASGCAINGGSYTALVEPVETAADGAGGD